MSIAALVTGKLIGAPERRTGPSGRAYVMTRLRVDDEHGLVTVFAFGSAGDVLMTLGAGATVSVSGRLKVGTWTKDGEVLPSLSVTVDALLTLHERAHIDRAVRRARDASKQRGNVERSHREIRATWHGDGA
ncbi:single-stranded DNA-binding protein [Variovorax sp. Sphag1AA]|uniref:single-stranded DNA-binding protein n=1 Tax=Variovorax sp. Sphag1AA TaxID=2587027 RepID=UPI00160DC6A8|nr:single-stranded DNA-binding protein [Variovorax sp. Sphag1AA]MBB3175896.1 RPA family protein [Variovorax sp. Sphag1AA]